MKAVVLKKNGELVLEDRNIDQPNNDECRIRIGYCGVCSSDIARGFEFGAYNYPLVMGHELSGTVELAGSECRKFKPGDRVGIFPLKPCFSCPSCIQENYAQCASYDYYGSRCDGGYGESLNVKEWNLVALPQDVELEDAALIEPLSVVVHGLKKVGLLEQEAKGQRVLIIGCGFLGLLAVQVLEMLESEVEVYVCDRNKFKLELAKEINAKSIHLENEAAWNTFLQEMPDSFDTVLEMTGFPDNIARTVELVSKRGEILLLGNVSGDVSLNKTLVSKILRKEVKIIGSWNSTYRPGKADDWLTSLELIRNGLKPSKLVTHWTSAEDTPVLLNSLAKHKARQTVFEHLKCMIRHD